MAGIASAPRTIMLTMIRSIVSGSILVSLATADTAANCHYEDIKGKWLLHYTDGGYDNTIKKI